MNYIYYYLPLKMNECTSQSGVRMKEEEGLSLQFKIGEAGELKSFQIGFRGAWFPFKIIDFLLKQNKLKLEYLYYDDGIQTEKIYEVPPYSRKSNPSHKQLMIRPSYPLIYHKDTMPSVISEVCVLINGPWKVEDLVDAFDEGCFWSGRVTKVLSEDKVQIEYPLPPLGDGKEDEIYEALCKDLRPTLVWSQEEGWILPTMEGRTAGDAQLIFPSQQGTDSEKEEVEDAEAVGEKEDVDDAEAVGEKQEVDDAEAVGESPLDAYCTGTSNGTGISLDSLVEGETEKQNSEAMDAALCEDVKRDYLESIDSIVIIGVQDSNAAAFEKGIDSIDLNIMHEETLEAPILDLEELANKVKWLKRILHSHQRPSYDTTPWKFA